MITLQKNNLYFLTCVSIIAKLFSYTQCLDDCDDYGDYDDDYDDDYDYGDYDYDYGDYDYGDYDYGSYGAICLPEGESTFTYTVTGDTLTIFDDEGDAILSFTKQ